MTESLLDVLTRQNAPVKITLFPLLIVVMFSLAACGFTVNAQDVAAVRSELTTVQAEIKAAQMEDARYSGGLVKSLVAARLAILKQTEAMLRQRLSASSFGVSIKYTIDGKPFVLPASSKELLASVEREVADNLTKIKLQEAETARYSGGLVQAMSLSTLATMRQTEAMLDQKRLALKYGMPQYLGFAKQTEAQTKSQVASVPSSAPETKDWDIVSVATRVTESNNVWSKYAWKLTLKNISGRPQLFSGTIEFQDADGFIVDTSDARNLAVPAGSEAVFTGYALIRAEVAGKVARTVAKIGKER